MARPAGARNADYDDKRDAVAGRLAEALAVLGPGASLRQLADRSGVSPSVIKHYFGDRDGAVAAVFALHHAGSRPHTEAAAIPAPGTARDALLAYLRTVVDAWRRWGVGRLHRLGLGEGLVSGSLGPAYVQELLEPTLVPAERLLEALVSEGRLPALEARGAALALVGPVVLALLHQDELGGAGCRPLDVDAFVARHVDGWLRGWGSGP